MPTNNHTVDATHPHGALAEIIFLLRTKEHQINVLELIIQNITSENRKLAEWNRKYFELLYGNTQTTQERKQA